jgi:hypothetical protein
MNTTMTEARWDLLRSIARETMGIESFEPRGKATTDFRVIGVENLARALEAAYDAGLVVGYSVAKDRDPNIDGNPWSSAPALNHHE